MTSRRSFLAALAALATAKPTAPILGQSAGARLWCVAYFADGINVIQAIRKDLVDQEDLVPLEYAGVTDFPINTITVPADCAVLTDEACTIAYDSEEEMFLDLIRWGVIS